MKRRCDPCVLGWSAPPADWSAQMCGQTGHLTRTVILKSARTSRLSDEWNEGNYDVLADRDGSPTFYAGVDD
jgi:hypothetical protein